MRYHNPTSEAAAEEIVRRTEVGHMTLIVGDDETPTVLVLPAVQEGGRDTLALRLTKGGVTPVVSREYALALMNAIAAELTRPEIEADKSAAFARLDADTAHLDIA